MHIIVISLALLGAVAGLLIALFSKKAENVERTKLDKAGWVTNVLLIPIYICLSPVSMGLGLFSYPDHTGFLGVLGWIITAFNVSSTMFCGLGLGLSVALRKKGKSKQSFIVQFAGLAAILLTVIFYAVFVDNLLSPLN